jgi:hypothetical protein
MVVMAQAATGAFAEARATMAQIPERYDPAGGVRGAMQFLLEEDRVDDAMRVAAELLPGGALEPWLWLAIATAHATAGRSADAAAAVAQLGPSADDADQAVGLAIVGRAAEALAAAGRIANPRARVEAIQRIAGAHAQVGRLDAASEAARALEDPVLRVQALQAAAESFDDPELAAEAIAAAALAPERGAWLAPGLAATLARTQATDGRRDAALATARGIADRAQRAQALVDVGAALRDPAVAAEALQAIAAVPDRGQREPLLRAAALAALAAGREDDARALARQTVDPDAALRALAVELARAQRPTDALAMARDIASPFWRAHALAEIAPLLPR